MERKGKNVKSKKKGGKILYSGKLDNKKYKRLTTHFNFLLPEGHNSE